MKKAVGFSLFLLLLSTVFLLVLASGNTDPFLHFLNVTPIESLLSATDQAKLLETYADEFAFLNQKHGNTIRSIDESAIKLIQAEASAVAIEGNGLAFAKDGKWGFINGRGTQVIDYLLVEAGYFDANGKCPAKMDGNDTQVMLSWRVKRS